MILSERVSKCYDFQPKSESVKITKDGLGSESDDSGPANTNHGLGSSGLDVSGSVVSAGAAAAAAGGVAAAVAAGVA